MKKLVGILVLTAACGSVAAQESGGSTREAAIAYWTSGYAGAEFAGSNCVAPQLPALPRTSALERHAADAIRTWKDCHRRLLGALAPEAAHKAIPADLRATMTPAESAAALRHVAAVHARLGDALQANAVGTIAAQQAWQTERQRRLDIAADRFNAGRDKYAGQDSDSVRRNEVALRP